MKRPSFQFYPADWLTDAALRMVSIGARGLWIDMLCLMHQGTQYGFLKVNNKVIHNLNLARMVGSTIQEVEGWLEELNSAGVYSIDEFGCIYSRRMIRDEKLRAARASGGILGGNPNLKKVNLNSTPSSSSSSSINKQSPHNNRDPFQWSKSENGILAKAKEIGVTSRPGESWDELKNRIILEMKNQKNVRRN